MTDPTIGEFDSYSVPDEAAKVFKNGILQNTLIASNLPQDFESYAKKVSFHGSPSPMIPINWRFAESISALKGLEALFVNALLVKKYNLEPQEIVIDTDHAQLFLMSSLLWQINNGDGSTLTSASFQDKAGKELFDKYIYDADIYSKGSTGMYRTMATNIYKTKDNRYFHLHGSMNPEPSQDAIGVPHTKDSATFQESITPYIEAIAQLTSEELQHCVTDTFRQAGTICHTISEYAESAHGKANAKVGLYEVHERPNASQPPTWWTSTFSTSPSRPLAGLKVVDLTRIIAAPAVTRGLAELGASIMRVTAPHLPDLSALHPDLNWGKWNSSLDLRKLEDRQLLRELILEADIVVSGYRPGSLEKYGFGAKDIVDMCSEREKGIIVAQENCYGWYGPWAGRSGWQQISDAVSSMCMQPCNALLMILLTCGVSMEFGRAMGLDEPVTPVYPNSDYCTGVAGLCGILDAILRRAEHGGSYQVDIALNYYSQWLVSSVGTYSAPVWDALWSANGRQVFRHYQGMLQLLPVYMGMLFKNNGAKLFKPAYFETRSADALGPGKGITMKIVKPVLKFPDGLVNLGFNVSTRGNGVDAPRWPEDLSVEIVM